MFKYLLFPCPMSHATFFFLLCVCTIILQRFLFLSSLSFTFTPSPLPVFLTHGTSLYSLSLLLSHPLSILCLPFNISVSSLLLLLSFPFFFHFLSPFPLLLTFSLLPLHVSLHVTPSPSSVFRYYRMIILLFLPLLSNRCPGVST